MRKWNTRDVWTACIKCKSETTLNFYPNASHSNNLLNFAYARKASQTHVRKLCKFYATVQIYLKSRDHRKTTCFRCKWKSQQNSSRYEPGACTVYLAWIFYLRTILWRVNQHLEKNKFSERVNCYNKSNKRRLKTMDIPAWLCLFFQYLPCLLFVPQQAVKTLPHFQYLDKINEEVARWGHSNLHKNCHGGLRYTQSS